jgi:Tfp pilus assembly protein PilN
MSESVTPDLPNLSLPSRFDPTATRVPTVVLVIVVVLAAVFVGYLLFDAWQIRQRNKHIQRLVQRRTKDD